MSEQCGQEVHLGITWQYFRECPPGAKSAWDFVSLVSTPQLTADEIAGYLPGIDRARGQRWMSLQPLDRALYRPDVRTIDLVQRLLAAKIAGAEAIFIERPFDPDSGLLHEDGSPTELLLPWRTTALALAFAAPNYLIGQLCKVAGRQHEPAYLHRGDDVVMVVWNREQVEEVVYLGQDIQCQTDVWGRRVAPARRNAPAR